MGTLVRDLRYAVRVLARTPGLTAVIVVTLALGIGANTAIFSVVNAVVLRPLPFDDPDRLVMVWETFRRTQQGSVSFPNLEDWRKQNRVFERMAGFHPRNHTLTGLGDPERIRGARVTADFLPLLGVQPALGRAFTPEDDQAGAENVVILSHGFWQSHLAGDPATVGNTLMLDDAAFTIVGVLPERFDFPVRLSEAQVWTPAALDAVCFNQRGWPMLAISARLKPGATLEQARAQMDTIQKWLEQEYPETSSEHGIRVVPLHEQVVGHVRPVLLILFGAVGLVLLIACANVASLLLARAAGRRKELAVRAALGAGRLRLARHLLTESVVLALGGGALGIALAVWGLQAIVAVIPSNVPRVENVAIDGRVLGFTLALSLLTSLIFGLAPALQGSQSTLPASLKEGGTFTAATGRRRLRQSLVVVEVATAFVLLTAAGLLLRSFQSLTQVDPGFKPDNVLTFQISLGWKHQWSEPQRVAFFDRVLERLEALPGVHSVSGGATMPLLRTEIFRFTIVGRPEPASRRDMPRARYNSVSADYFKTMRIPLLGGRTFTEQDKRSNRPGAVIINESLARRFWPDQDPIGQRIRSTIDIDELDPREFEVVGIVGDVRGIRLDEEAMPCIYAPHRQQTFPYMSFAVRTAGDPTSLIGPIRQEIAGITSKEAAFAFRTMNDVLGQARSVVQRRFPMQLLTAFAAVALALAAIGTYGVLSYSVAQRTHEIGVRLALGAQRGSVLRLVLGQGLTLALVGLVLGLTIALAAAQLLSSLLFQTTASDPVTFVVTSLALLLVAAVACYLPARRATKVDPMVALRCE